MLNSTSKGALPVSDGPPPWSGLVLNDAIGCWFPGGFGTEGEGEGVGTVAVSISYGDGAFEFTGSSGADCRHLATYAVGTRTVTICVTDVNCPSWPICWDDPPLHPYQCRSYTVNAVP